MVRRKVSPFRIFLVVAVIGLSMVLVGSLGYIALHYNSDSSEEMIEEEPEVVEEPSGLSDREQAYAALHPELDEKEIKKQVGMNLDQEPYSSMEPVPDPDSIRLLVNKYYNLDAGYEPADLTGVSSSGENGTVMMRAEAAEAFEQLVQASASQGFILNACSAYRSYAYQNQLYSDGVANYGQAYADAYWTRPGSSEHQTGLCVDIRMDNDTSDLDAVRYHPSYDWLTEHMHEYGFILRYPDDKEEYTLISPESWHLRYVGVDAAAEIYQNGWCLEEYHYYHNLEA